jgi:uncharacterized protein (DUF58 family)
VHNAILRAGDYELIKAMSLSARRRVSGFAAGEQRSPARGGGIEFADYREYQAGDDVRLVDWSVYLRMRKLMVRLCAEEKELTLALVLDSSRSMDSGRPNKLAFARRVAAVLAGIAMRSGNRVGVCELAGSLLEPLRPERNRVGLGEVQSALARVRARDSFAPAAAMRQFASRYGRKCLALLISDFLYPEWAETIAALAASGCESHIMQVYSPEEESPPLLGEITLVDSENDEEVPLIIDAPLVSAYARALETHSEAVRRQAARLGIGRSRVSSAEAMERVFRRDLAGSGLVC